MKLNIYIFGSSRVMFLRRLYARSISALITITNPNYCIEISLGRINYLFYRSWNDHGCVQNFDTRCRVSRTHSVVN